MKGTQKKKENIDEGKSISLGSIYYEILENRFLFPLACILGLLDSTTTSCILNGSSSRTVLRNEVAFPT